MALKELNVLGFFNHKILSVVFIYGLFENDLVFLTISWLVYQFDMK